MSEVTIGEAAGSVWKLLAEQGPLPFEDLANGLGEDRDLASMAIGWLARENKLHFEREGRNVILSLKGHESSRPAVRRPIAARR